MMTSTKLGSELSGLPSRAEHAGCRADFGSAAAQALTCWPFWQKWPTWQYQLHVRSHFFTNFGAIMPCKPSLALPVLFGDIIAYELRHPQTGKQRARISPNPLTHAQHCSERRRRWRAAAAHHVRSRQVQRRRAATEEGALTGAMLRSAAAGPAPAACGQKPAGAQRAYARHVGSNRSCVSTAQPLQTVSGLPAAENLFHQRSQVFKSGSAQYPCRTLSGVTLR